jgi:chemotaxis regulatin CheY-phosphate phosphatase CheZ
MNQQEVESVLQKAAEVKVFCEYGQRTLPVLDEIAAFLREISPAVEDLKAVLEVAMENIPKAAGQLGRVTEATEQASTQILNTLDKMVITLDQIITAVSTGMLSSDLGGATNKMAGVVKALVEKSGWDADIVALAEAWEAHLRSIKKSGTTGELELLLKNLQDDCTEIMMALQVSDITQQHIGTVMGTIQAVAQELSKLTTGFFSGVKEVHQASISLQLPSDSDLVGDNERKKMVESLLTKARAGQL